MSLHTTVQDGLAARLHRGSDTHELAPFRTLALPARISISSMRVLETALALGAIATAVLMGIGR